MATSSFNDSQLEQLQLFLKDWLRHSGRTQADLRRALRASSIRMPVLIEELDQLHQRQGLTGLAEKLCQIEAIWQLEEGQRPDQASSSGPSIDDSLSQLDLLLEEIRQDQQDS